MIKKHKPRIGDYVMAECYKAELAKVKKQLAIAVEALFHYSSDNKDYLSNEDKETADQALQKIKELQNA